MWCCLAMVGLLEQDREDEATLSVLIDTPNSMLSQEEARRLSICFVQLRHTNSGLMLSGNHHRVIT